MSTDSLFVLLEVCGLGLALINNPNALRKMERRYETRAEWTRRTGIIKKRFSPEVRQMVVREHMAERGGRAGARGMRSGQKCPPRRVISLEQTAQRKRQWEVVPMKRSSKNLPPVRQSTQPPRPKTSAQVRADLAVRPPVRRKPAPVRPYAPRGERP